MGVEADEFAEEIGQCYRELYRLAVRRVGDPRDRPSPEMVVLLSHLAEAGPSTLGELSLHIDRAPSTLSAKVTALESDGLLARQRDEDDRRRSLIWLTPAGRHAYRENLRVLDHDLLRRAAERLPTDRRELLVDLLTELIKDVRAEGPARAQDHTSPPIGDPDDPHM